MGAGILVNPSKTGLYSVPLANVAQFPYENTVVCIPALYTAITRTTAGTTDYSTSPIMTVGSTPINGYLIPEQYLGLIQNLTANVDWATNHNNYAYTTTTGAQNLIVRRRFLLNVPLQAVKAGKFRFYTLDSLSPNAGVYENTNTGETGTVTVTVVSKKMDSSGTLTTIATGTQTLTLDGTTDLLPIDISKTDTDTTLTAGDKIVLDVEINVNQTARASGAGAVGAGYYTGRANSTSTFYTVTKAELYFE